MIKFLKRVQQIENIINKSIAGELRIDLLNLLSDLTGQYQLLYDAHDKVKNEFKCKNDEIRELERMNKLLRSMVFSVLGEG